MVDFGQYCLLAAFLLSAYGLLAGIVGVVKSNPAWIRSAENSVVAHFGMTLAAIIALWQLIFTDQFQVAFVASVSSTTIPFFYKVTALWGGQSGSLLFWTGILSALSMVAVLQNRRRNRTIMPYAGLMLTGTLAFFTLLVKFRANPFTLRPDFPAEGIGLNPLLQNYWMAIHPPILYIGLISVTLPFAFAMGALLSGKLDTSWIPTTRRWSLFSFSFLALGFTLGGVWAYEELGWGGYWAWDPVENASFMPWLALTAFLHSVMITEKKGMLKTWNFLLVLAAFELTIFGTFITRSGVVQSVHAFAQSSIGPYFVGFLLLSSLVGLIAIAYRSPQLVSEGRMHSFLSREATFLLNNWLFLAICFAVFWGTVFPIVSEWVTGEKITVSAPFFNKVTWPLGLGLLALTGVCPLIAWRKASARNFQRNFLWPLAGGFLFGLAALALGVRDTIPLLFFLAAGFVAATIVFEFYKGARARQTIRPTGFVTAVADLTAMNKRRYGGFIIHAGVVLAFIGIVGSSFYQTEEAFTLQAGQTQTVGRYSLTYHRMEEKRDAEKIAFFAWLDAYRDGELLGRFYPQLHRHFKQDQVVSEVAVRSSWTDDLYIVLSSWDEQGNVSFRVFINPLVNWIWVGIAIMVLGGFFVMLPNRKPHTLARARKKESEMAEAAA